MGRITSLTIGCVLSFSLLAPMAVDAQHEALLIPSYTKIHIVLDQPLDSETALNKGRLAAHVAEDVMVDGKLVLKCDSPISATLTVWQSKGSDYIRINFDTLVFNNEKTVHLNSIAHHGYQLSLKRDGQPILVFIAQAPMSKIFDGLSPDDDYLTVAVSRKPGEPFHLRKGDQLTIRPVGDVWCQ